MNPAREQMMQRIGEAVAAGNRAGGSPPLPQRGNVGYQGAGEDVIARFSQELVAAGGKIHLVANHSAARGVILEMIHSRSIQRVFLGKGDVLDELQLAGVLQDIGIEVLIAGSPEAENRSTLFQAELGISGVDYLIAETGSVVLESRPKQPRLLSLLPPLHIAVAERRQILPDLFDLFAVLGNDLDGLPANLSIITGPSKTGDIELRLVTGVHGPGEVQVILIAAPD